MNYTPVILESPYAGDRERNASYLDACIRDCISRGEAPFASHRMYTSALDDDVPAERDAGIAAGFAWRSMATKTVVYTDLGVSRGMRYGIDHAASIGQDIEYRSLLGHVEDHRTDDSPIARIAACFDRMRAVYADESLSWDDRLDQIRTIWHGWYETLALTPPLYEPGVSSETVCRYLVEMLERRYGAIGDRQRLLASASWKGGRQWLTAHWLDDNIVLEITDSGIDRWFYADDLGPTARNALHRFVLALMLEESC